MVLFGVNRCVSVVMAAVDCLRLMVVTVAGGD